MVMSQWSLAELEREYGTAYAKEIVGGMSESELAGMLGTRGSPAAGSDVAEQLNQVLGGGTIIGKGVTALAPFVSKIPVIGGALAGLLGLGAAGYGIYQALGGGEGGGIGGINLLGGDEFQLGGIEFGGPGLAEPPAKQVIKEWHVNYDWGRLQYYLVQTARGRKIAMYNTRTKQWKVWTWRKPHLAIIGKNLPSHKQLTRLKRNLSRHATDARTILTLVRPHALRKTRRYGRRR